MSGGGNLPNLKQLRKMVKETESKLKGGRIAESEEDIIREYEIPEPRTKAVLKEEMEALENQLTEHFEEHFAEDDLNLSEGSDNKELDVVSPFSGTMRDIETLGKSHGTELKDSVFLAWSGPADPKPTKSELTEDEAARRIKEQEITIQEQQAVIRQLNEQLRLRERQNRDGEERKNGREDLEAKVEQYEKEMRLMEEKYQSLLNLCQDFEAKSRSLLQANRLLQDHLLRLTQAST